MEPTDLNVSSNSLRSRTAPVFTPRDFHRRERFDLRLIILFFSFESYYLIFALSDSLVPLVTLLNFLTLLLLVARKFGLRSSQSTSPPIVSSSLSRSLLIIILIYGFAIGISNFGLLTTAISLRTILYPYLIFRVVSRFSKNQIEKILIFLGFAMFLNALSSILEIVVGVEFLVSNFPSFKYGGSIREIGADLRPPGLMRSNVHLGLAGAIYALILINSNQVTETLSKLKRSIFLFSALTCVILATSRSAYILLIIGWFMYKNRGLGSRLFGKVIAPSFIAFVTLFVFSPEVKVLYQRILVWGDVTSLITFFGNGIGSIGSATASRYSSQNIITYRTGYSDAIFADNYYLSLLYQFGWIMGLGLIIVILYASAQLIMKTNGGLNSYLKGVIAGYCMVALFLDIGEYYFASTLICVGFLAINSAKRQSTT